jgi:phage I-like protein
VHKTPLSRILVPLAAGDADAAGLLPLPDRLIIAPWGAHTLPSGAVVTVSDATLSCLAANQAKTGHGEIALDFNHNTYATTGADGKPAKVVEPVPVAAYGTLSVEKGVGVILSITRWTPQGREYYQGGHYRDLSPTIGTDKAGNIIFIHSCALCRQGQIPGLHAFAATIDLPVETTTKTQPTETMDFEALVKKLLGLPDTATAEEIAAAAEAFKPAAAAEPEAETTPDLAALSARLETIERDNIVLGATLEGKIIPLSADAVKTAPLQTLRDMVAGLPAGQVPVARQTQPAAAPSTIKALSAEDKAIAKQLGISEADFAKL